VARKLCPAAQRQLGFRNASTADEIATDSDGGGGDGVALRASLTSPARLALSGKLMGYAHAPRETSCCCSA